jgi:two-component system NarL family sensor kinase
LSEISDNKRKLGKSPAFLPFNYGQKLFLLATVPLILAVTAISLLVAYQARELSEQELHILETKLIETKQAEILNYMSLARSSISLIYGRALPDDEKAKLEVTQILSAMTYGDDGFFFVYDYEGNNIVSPKQTYLIGKNWITAKDRNGKNVVAGLINTARQGGGYQRYVWPKPSTGQATEMITYVVGLQDWRWAIGTGIYIDDITADVAAARAETEERIRKTFFWIGIIVASSLLVVFLSGFLITARERRLADEKLKELAQRIIDTQEEERGRVARELHDGISQILIGVRYALELADRNFKSGKMGVSDSLNVSKKGLNEAIQEVRRISRDLRPGALDDLGLGPALNALISDFSKRTGIETEFETVVFSNRLQPDAKTALYRVAQEALTNIERHANATTVLLEVFGNRKGLTLRIVDNGIGFKQANKSSRSYGLGLRNMQERVEHLDGSLTIVSSSEGTTVEANVPPKQLLSPNEDGGPKERKTA